MSNATKKNADFRLYLSMSSVKLSYKLESNILKNIKLKNVSVLGSKYVGAVAGYVYYGNVNNCHVSEEGLQVIF